ncbi:MAG: ABC transporter ATP-binding protein [Clostridia bacterium]|nr:ABC transporter ATP-binding protein [Clostridia bacterium]
MENIIGGIIITLIMDSFLALVMICVLPLIFITVYFISKKGVPLYVVVQRSVDRMIGVVRETAQGIRVIKALSKTEYEHRRYEKANTALVENEIKVGRIMSAVNPVMNLLMNVGITAVVALSANRVAGHMSDPETVVAFMQYFTMISMAMMSITRIFNMFTKALASAKRIEEVIESKDDLTVGTEEEYPPLKEHGFIDFVDVSFSYNGKKNNAESISFSLKKGESLGIIGATGSGKSTVIRLLMRLYDADSGNIYINGRNVKTFKRDELYSLFGSSMQQDFLYADTVKENILFGRDATDDEVFEAARVAQAHDFIQGFNEGYEHILSQKATNISGGQKQRLLIARAILKKPEILVLDDSSSALDYKTDALVRKAIKEFLSGTTCVTVAQRVSTVKDSDIILVLDEGKIIAKGTHEELLTISDEYREISQSQMGGAFVE